METELTATLLLRAAVRSWLSPQELQGPAWKVAPQCQEEQLLTGSCVQLLLLTHTERQTRHPTTSAHSA